MSGNLLAALGDAGKNGDGTKYWDGPKQLLTVARFLQVKAGYVGTKKVRPRQKETDAQTDGAQIDQLCPGQGDGLIVRRSSGRSGFRFRFYGNFIGHIDFSWFMVYTNIVPADLGSQAADAVGNGYELTPEKISVNGKDGSRGWTRHSTAMDS